MSFSVIIPARYASTRLEGKPLLDIAGKPMIEHVYKRATDSQAERVIIATDDQRIYDTATGFGATVCMTRSDHESGTDRLQEVVSQMQMPDDHIVVNVQGDEPLIPPTVINQVANNLANNPQAGMATLVEPISDEADVFNPDIVKAVMDKQGRALYFSRAPIPWNREAWNRGNYNKAMPGSETRHSKNDSKAMRSSETSHKEYHSKATPGCEARCTQTPAVANRDHNHVQHHSEPALAQLTQHYCRHIGIYAYRVAFLHQFVGWPVSTLETIEKLEQLRALDNGVTIHASHTVAAIPGGVDTREDLEKVRALFC